MSGSESNEVAAGAVSNRSYLMRLRLMLTNRPVLAIFCLAFVSRSALVALATVLVDGPVFGDDATYSLMARQVANGLTGTWDEYTHTLYRSTATFSLPLTAVYMVLGENEIYGQLLAALFGAATAALTTRLALEVVGRRWALAAGVVMALFPSQVLWSSLILKDPAVWAVGAGLATVVALTARRQSYAGLASFGLGAGIGLLLMAHLRAHTLVVAAWALALASGVGVSGRARWYRGVLGTGLAVLVPLLLGLGPGGADVVTNAGSLESRRYFNALDAATAFVPVDSLAPERARERAQAALRAAREAEAAAARAREEASEAEVRAAELEGPKAQEVASEAGAARRRAEEYEDAAQRAELSYEQMNRAARELETLAQGSSQDGQGPVDGADPATGEGVDGGAVAAPDGYGAGDGGDPSTDEGVDGGAGAAPEGAGSLTSDIRHLPRGLSIMLLEPYPWEWGDNSRVNIARLETLLWYPLLLLSVIGLWPALREARSTTLFPLAFGAGTLLVYALSEGNFGTAYRHRGEFVWVVVLLAAVGAEWLWERSRGRDAVPGRDGAAPTSVSEALERADT